MKFLTVLKRELREQVVNVSASLYTRGKIIDLEKLVTGEGFSPFWTYENTKLCNVLFTLLNFGKKVKYSRDYNEYLQEY